MIKYNKHIDNIIRNDTAYGSIDALRLHASERDSVFIHNMWNDFKSSLSQSDIRYYPDVGKGYRLLEDITKIDKSHLMLFDGSDRAIRNIFQIYVEPGSNVITTSPGFPMYEVYTKMFNGNLIDICYSNMQCPVNEIVSAINDKTNLVILSNPNSPLGNLINITTINRILETCIKYNIMLAIDEAYIEFSNQSSMCELAKIHPNLIVIKTFSKAFGSAGIRVGYTVSTKSNRDLLNKIKSMNDITSMSISWLEVLSKYKDQVDNYVNDVKMNRQHLLQTLKTHNVNHIGSCTNFIHIDLKKELSNILTKQCQLFNTNYVRVSIPGDEQNYKLLLNQILESI